MKAVENIKKLIYNKIYLNLIGVNLQTHKYFCW